MGQGGIPNEGAPWGWQSAGLSHFGGNFYILYMRTVGGLGKEPISSKSKLGNHWLNLILHIPGRVQYKFQAPFKMIFLEKKALDCGILIENWQRAFNKNDSSNVPSLMYSNNFLSCWTSAFREGMDITHVGIQYFLPLGPRSPTSPHCGGTGDLGPRGFL